ncbi:MAG: ATP-binding protein, partial [Chloroflexota bacterium]
MTRLTPAQLRRTFDSPELKFEFSDDLEPNRSIIGQPRGVMAIEFALEMVSSGYNVFVLGAPGTGKTSTIRGYIEGRIHDRPIPNDWIYINNFQTPHAPIALELPAGEGCHLRDRMAAVISRLRNELASAFDNERFRNEVLVLRQQLEAERNQLMSAFQRRAGEQGAALMQTSEGFRLLPMKNGEPVDAEGYQALSDGEKESWRVLQNTLEQELTEVMYAAREIQNSMEDRMEDLVQRVAASVVDLAIADLVKGFESIDILKNYFSDLRADILKNIQIFQQVAAEAQATHVPDEWFRRYEINVIIDHQQSKSAPIVVEYDLSLPRLLGRVEHEGRPGGAVVTDFTLLRPGALHRANGGYLIIRARDLFTAPMSYDALKRALLGNEVRPDDPAIRGGAATRTLDPQPIGLNLKVILIGPPSLYYQLAGLDEDFDSIFKVMADFDETIERNAENELAYATFIAA